MKTIMKTTHTVYIDQEKAVVDGTPLSIAGSGHQMLKDLYRERVGHYSKFYKMDLLCQLGFLASELLLQAEGGRILADDGCVAAEQMRTDRAVILFSKSGSAVNDQDYYATISREDDYFPSPSCFIYTLPNIVTGEICIRNRYMGESNMILLPAEDNGMMQQAIEASFLDPETGSVLTGWIDCHDDQHFMASLRIVEK